MIGNPFERIPFKEAAWAEACVAALEGSPGHGAGLAIDGIHILHSAWEARHLASLSAAFAGLLVAVISLGTSAHHLLPANQVLPQLGEEITEKLASFGAGSLELFAAVNLDLSSEDWHHVHATVVSIIRRSTGQGHRNREPRRLARRKLADRSIEQLSHRHQQRRGIVRLRLFKRVASSTALNGFCLFTNLTDNTEVIVRN